MSDNDGCPRLAYFSVFEVDLRTGELRNRMRSGQLATERNLA